MVWKWCASRNAFTPAPELANSRPSRTLPFESIEPIDAAGPAAASTRTRNPPPEVGDVAAFAATCAGACVATCSPAAVAATGASGVEAATGAAGVTGVSAPIGVVDGGGTTGCGVPEGVLPRSVV